MAQPASRYPALDEEAPSLDPAAIERAYLRERARRRARIERREYARSSNARFWVVLAVLFVLTVVIALFAFHQIQTTFGI
jgi:uncharacterized integral membrane protein